MTGRRMTRLQRNALSSSAGRRCCPCSRSQACLGYEDADARALLKATLVVRLSSTSKDLLVSLTKCIEQAYLLDLTLAVARHFLVS